MKKTLIAVAGVAILATAASFSVSYWAACRHQLHTADVSQGLHDAGWLTRELGLGEQQASEIQALEKEFRAQLELFCATHCAARFALGEELGKAKPDADKARAHVEKMNAVQADAEQATLEHMLKVRALLTEEQGQRYASIIHHQVCTACPLGIHKSG